MKKKKLLKKFIRVFSATFTMLLFVSIIGFATYIFVSKQYGTGDKKISDIFRLGKDKQDKEVNEEPVKENIRIAVYGTDLDGYRTDVIMFVNFNTITKNIDIISVPRDTKVTLSDDVYNELKQHRKSLPRNMKINGVPAYSPATQRNKFAVQVLEESLGTEVDYYIKLKLDGFKEIVNLIGGVEVNVPKDMKYSDPYQDLYINLKKGVQLLDGNKAEQLIRYRKGYADADLGRIKVQHDFMKQFVKTILSNENKKNLIKIITTTMEYLDTDLTLTDALKYVKFINDINVEQIKFSTLPGEPAGDYFVMDKDKTSLLVNEIATKTTINGAEPTEEEKVTTEPEKEKEKEISSKDKKIEILNGAKINGLAKEFKEKLEKDGLKIERVDTYKKSVLTKTQIIVKEEGMGKDLVKYFNNPEIIVDTLPENTDIRIILGTDK